jgi:hypothetical protein
MQDYENSMPPDDCAAKFQRDFVCGSLTFITIAAMVQGDTRDPETIFNEMMNPVVGNRNRNRTGFDQVMPEMYRKVIDYCSQAIEVSNTIENKEMQQ